jgi:hypothetical protein
MKNLMMRMGSAGMMMMRIVDMIMMVMVVRKNLMMQMWMIKIRWENRKVGQEIKWKFRLALTTWRTWTGKMMSRMRIWRGMGNMEMGRTEIGKIGVRTEQVPPTALNKRRQKITSNPSLCRGEEVEEVEEEEKGGKERKDEDGGVIDPHLGEGKVAEEAEEVEEEGEGVALDQEEAVVDEDGMATEKNMRRSEGRDGNQTRIVARVMD